jgi:hypothetical protein
VKRGGNAAGQYGEVMREVNNTGTDECVNGPFASPKGLSRKPCLQGEVYHCSYT